MKRLGELHTGEAKLDAQSLGRGDAHHTVGPLPGERFGIAVSAVRLTFSSPHLRLSFGSAGRAETTLVLPPRRVRRRRRADRIRALLAVALTVVSSPAGSESGPSRID